MGDPAGQAAKIWSGWLIHLGVLALLAFLRNHVTRPAFTYRHRWQPNDLLLWDNRSLVHAAIVDYDDTMPRYLHRVTVAGQPPQR